MQNLLLIFQITLGVLITGAILIQSQGSGLGSTWGGGGETYHTKRGVEKAVFYFTIGAIVLFTVVSLAVVLI